MARYFHYNLLSGFNSRLREEATYMRGVIYDQSKFQLTPP